MRRFHIMFSLLMLLNACQGGLFSQNPGLMDQAESLAHEQRYAEAIEVYRRHMLARLAVKDRPDWENPALYLLTMGDLELRQGNIQQAISYYEQAEKENVSKELVSDRYRGIASEYESRGDLEHAVEILKRYRDRDPLLFDGMLDRLSKQIVAEEDARN